MSRFAHRLATVLALATLAAPVVGAEPAATTAPTALELTVVGGPELNPSAQGRPSPVVVRIFDLASTPAFEAADLTKLFEHVEALKGTVLAIDELILHPGDIEERNRDLKPTVRMLGVAAAFREQDGAVWRITVPLRPGTRNFLLVQLDHNRIRFQTQDSK
jgi:type VI secretion system protein VasD